MLAAESVDNSRYFVYILADAGRCIKHIGVTGDLFRCIYEYKQDVIAGFSPEMRGLKLVYFEPAEDLAYALVREAAMRECGTALQIELIESTNPTWQDICRPLVRNYERSVYQ
ncbi:MAG: GIY-YIG nuclease family protein [Chitinivibrionales bacterium]|nr:GIY-YIG nuclease family protein [Chitinivibrionales bacterium]